MSTMPLFSTVPSHFNFSSEQGCVVLTVIINCWIPGNQLISNQLAIHRSVDLKMDTMGLRREVLFPHVALIKV